MRLGTVRIRGTAARPVGLVGERVIDIAEAAFDLGLIEGPYSAPHPRTLVELFDLGRYGDALLADLEKAVQDHGDVANAPWAFGLDEVTFLAPVPRPGKVVCVGGNKENPGDPLDASMQDEWPRPIYFEKAPSAVTGHGATVEAWGVMRPVQVEGEICLIIGKRGRHLKAEDAMSVVAGCALLNDMSAGRFGLQDGMAIYISKGVGNPKEEMITRSMTRAKIPDGMCPIGPWLVPIADLGVPFEDLVVTTQVGPNIVQEGSVGSYGFSAGRCLEEISKWITLEPGDVVSLGAFAQKPDHPLRFTDAASEGNQKVVVSCPQLGELVTYVTLVDA